MNMMKDHPEMTDWVHSEEYRAPFYISTNNYTKIAVDRVQAADRRMHNVLLLSTGMLKAMHVYSRLCFLYITTVFLLVCLVIMYFV